MKNKNEDWLSNNPQCKQIESCSNSLSKKCICPKEEPKKDLEKEMFELEQELDIPSHLRWHNSKPKQKTLEEVAKKKYPMFKGETYIGNNKKMLKRAAFIAGAKWQQEQNKNLYSEEEVIAILENFSSTFNLITTTPKKWFEQFKNK